ncbi:hypothetical protein ABPG74_002051 [Tetrahymena malaccensis]
MQLLLKALILFFTLFRISKAYSCSSCYYGCCDYYGSCASYRSDCAYYNCYNCSINGNCAPYSECNPASSKTIIIVICVLAAVVVVGIAICLYIRHKKRQKIEQIRQNHLQAQLNAQNNSTTTSNNVNMTQQFAVGYPVPEYNQYVHQNQYPNQQIPYSGNIGGQISANQHPSQQYQCTIPTGEAIPNYQVQQQHPQVGIQPGYPTCQ